MSDWEMKGGPSPGGGVLLFARVSFFKKGATHLKGALHLDWVKRIYSWVA